MSEQAKPLTLADMNREIAEKCKRCLYQPNLDAEALLLLLEECYKTLSYYDSALAPLREGENKECHIDPDEGEAARRMAAEIVAFRARLGWWWDRELPPHISDEIYELRDEAHSEAWETFDEVHA